METRIVEQVKIFKLILNDMRSSNIEIGTLTPHISHTRQGLIDYLVGEEAESVWTDDSSQGRMWGKSFKKGSDLEWYNKPAGFDELNSYGQGIDEEWIDKTLLYELIENGKCILKRILF